MKVNTFGYTQHDVVVLGSKPVTGKGTYRISFKLTGSSVQLWVLGAYDILLKPTCYIYPVTTQETYLVDICDENKDRYRFGFNGQEKDNELKGIGNSLDFGERMYDSRLGRWMSIDPLFGRYAGLSPYNFGNNDPVRFIDYGGRNFGLKINNVNKTIVIVATIYTTNDIAYAHAEKGAQQWRDKVTTVDGYTVTFEINVKKPIVSTTEEAVAKDPTIVRKNGTLKQFKLEQQIDKITMSKIAKDANKNGPLTSNTYAGNKGKNSHAVSGEAYVGGQTENNWYADMNTHSSEGDLGANTDLVAHEFGHLWGLDDEKGGVYFSRGGIMEYNGSDLMPISDDDVKNILKSAKDVLEGKTDKNPSVQVIENIGTSDGNNPLGITNP